MRNHAAACVAAIASLLVPTEAGAHPRSALGGWTLDLTA